MPDVVSDRQWLSDTRVSYDTAAAGYADFVRDSLVVLPFVRGPVAIFADLVRVADGGPVADVGCGPGHVTAHLRGLGIDAFGVDLSPGMIDIARRDHPGVRFEVGSMTRLELGDTALAGLLAWFSIIHVPDDEVAAVFAEFHRVLRPGAPLLVGFHVGDTHRLKTEGYGGHPMRVYVYRRPPDRVAAWLRDAGFAVEAHMLIGPDGTTPSAAVFARRPL